MTGLLDASGKVNRAYVPDFTACVLPYCQWYQDDFLGGIRGMTAAAIGIYTVLLNEMYAQGRPLKMPVPRLARLCGTTVPTFNNVLAELIETGKICDLDAGLWNVRVDLTFTHRKKTQGVQSNAGLQSGKKRNENKGSSERTLNGRSTPVEPSSEAQKVSGGGTQARGDEPENSAGDPPPESDPTFRDQLLDAMGTDHSGLTGRGGTRIGTRADMLVAERWSTDLGLTEQEQIQIIQEVMASKQDGLPSTFGYFNKAMQRFAEAKAAPPLEINPGGIQNARQPQSRTRRPGKFSAERLNNIIGMAIKY